MPRVRLSRLLLVCLLMMVSATASHHAQTEKSPQKDPQKQPDKPPEGPTFRVGATYVRVDAYVTANGKPVTDLKPEEFEVYEDGVKQTVRNFELVSVPRGNLQTGERRDPNTIAEMRERVGEPRRRVFVLFVDTYHSKIGSGMMMRKPLQRFLERLIGPDDLVAGMTPDMSPESLAFGSRTESLDRFFDTIWGRSDSIIRDDEEDYIARCFSMMRKENAAGQALDHRRTKLTLDALEGLVKHVGDLREERKAIITISEGWDLFREDLSLNESNTPGRPLRTGPVIVEPTPHTGADYNGEAPSVGMCDKILMELANMETVQQFHDLPDKANRNNASFYIIDPRGLPASDDLLAPGRPPNVDIAILKTKLDQMRELAARTDGMALANSNDLDAELTRIADDLSSYYLLGYDSTNSKLDGGYRSLTVKVKRPGVLVRARKGYRSAVLPAAGDSTAHTGGGSKSPVSNDITSAVGAVMSTRGDLPVRLRATAVRLLDTTSSNGTAPRASEMRLVAELDPKIASSDTWRQGGIAHFIVRREGNDTPLSAEATLKPGDRTVSTVIPLPAGVTMGEYRVQMRLNAQTHTDALSDSTTVQIAAPGMIGAPTLLRRGPSTGIAYLTTADPRFRRADRLRLETPSRLQASQVKVSAVDQRGQPLNLPIQVSDRQDGAVTLIVADISLAALAPGGYAIVLVPEKSEDRVIVPFQLIP